MTAPGVLDTTFLRDATVTSVIRLFVSMGSWREAERFLSIALPVILGGQRAVAQTTAADLSRKLEDLLGPGTKLAPFTLADSSGKALRGVAPETVYRRPFEEIWRALQTKGNLEFDAALERGTTRLRSILETDLELSALTPWPTGRATWTRSPTVAYQRTDRVDCAPSRRPRAITQDH